MSGINRNPCVRNGPRTVWLGRHDSNLGMAESKIVPEKGSWMREDWWFGYQDGWFEKYRENQGAVSESQ